MVPSGPIGHLNDVRIVHAEGTGKKSQESDSDVMNLEVDLVRPPTGFDRHISVFLSAGCEA